MMFRLQTAVFFLVLSSQLAFNGPSWRLCHAGESAAELPAERTGQPKRPVSTDRLPTALLEEIARHDADLAKRVMAYIDNELQGLSKESEGLRKQLDTERQTRLQTLRTLEAEEVRIEQKLKEQERKETVLRVLEEATRKELESSVQRISDLRREVQNMRDELRERLGQHGASPEDGLGGVIRPASTKTLPDVEGVVTAVGEVQFVELSIGSDKGLLEGHLLDVFNAPGTDAQRVGRVRIVRTIANRAVGKVLPDFKSGDIKEGQRVKTVVKEDKEDGNK